MAVTHERLGCCPGASQPHHLAHPASRDDHRGQRATQPRRGAGCWRGVRGSEGVGWRWPWWALRSLPGFTVPARNGGTLVVAVLSSETCQREGTIAMPTPIKRILTVAAVAVSVAVLVLIGWFGRGVYQERQEQAIAVSAARKADTAESAEWKQELVNLSSRLVAGVTYGETPELQAKILSKATLYRLNNNTVNSIKRSEFGDEIASAMSDTKGIWDLKFNNKFQHSSGSYWCGELDACLSLFPHGILEKHGLIAKAFIGCKPFQGRSYCSANLDDAVSAMLTSVGESITKAIAFEKSL